MPIRPPRNSPMYSQSDNTMTRKKPMALLLACLVILSVSETLVSASPLLLARVISSVFFNRVVRSAAGPKLPGNAFYTRKALLQAATSFLDFVTKVTGREIAAFFAHVTHETGNFSYIEEPNGTSNSYCQKSTQYPCAAGKMYYGRGPLQLRWNYNYGAAGEALELDLLTFPEKVAQDPVVSFKTALWYWMTHVRPVMDQGFGATITAINSEDCNGGNPKAVESRINYFVTYCEWLGVSPGTNLSC